MELEPRLIVHPELHGRAYALFVCVCVQVLDDSTDPHTRQLVDDHALLWQERGVAVDVVRRTNRAGYKAGALKEVRAQGSTLVRLLAGSCCRAVLTLPCALQGLDILTDYDYIAIFDADFKPDPDFLVSGYC